MPCLCCYLGFLTKRLITQEAVNLILTATLGGTRRDPHPWFTGEEMRTAERWTVRPCFPVSRVVLAYASCPGGVAPPFSLTGTPF